MGVEEGEELIEEADRRVDVDGLKDTLRLARCTRLGVGLELVLCCCRSEEGEVVVYAQDVNSVGCSLQPIAAVRRVGTAPIMSAAANGAADGEL